MSEREKLPPSEAWKLVEDDVALQELERISSLSDADLDAELRAAGVDPEAAAKVGDDLIGDAGRDAGNVTKLPVGEAAQAARGKRPRWPAWVGGLSAAAVVALVLTALSRQDSGGTAGGNPTTKEQMAAEYRKAAFAACAEGKWDQCENNLDDAAGLNPASENDPRVKTCREQIRASRQRPDAATK